MKRLKLFTVLGAVIGAAIAGNAFFQGFTNKSNWHSSGGMSYITAQDSAIASGTGALVGGLTGVLIDEVAIVLLARRAKKSAKDLLVELRENPDLGQPEKEAIDLTLAQIETRT